jgi:hypothetical protein
VSGQLQPPAALSPGKESLVPIGEDGWTPEPVWTTWRWENSWLYRDSELRSLGRPVRSQSLCRLRYPGPSKSIYRWNYWNHQCGFWRNRATTDQIFCIRQILEKKWEYNETVHQLFVDFKKAFDSVGNYKEIAFERYLLPFGQELFVISSAV